MLVAVSTGLSYFHGVASSPPSSITLTLWGWKQSTETSHTVERGMSSLECPVAVVLMTSCAGDVNVFKAVTWRDAVALLGRVWPAVCQPPKHCFIDADSPARRGRPTAAHADYAPSALRRPTSVPFVTLYSVDATRPGLASHRLVRKSPFRFQAWTSD